MVSLQTEPSLTLHMLCLEKVIKEALVAGFSIVGLLSSFYNLCDLSLVVCLEGLEILITILRDGSSFNLNYVLNFHLT